MDKKPGDSRRFFVDCTKKEQSGENKKRREKMKCLLETVKLLDPDLERILPHGLAYHDLLYKKLFEVYPGSEVGTPVEFFYKVIGNAMEQLRQAGKESKITWENNTGAMYFGHFAYTNPRGEIIGMPFCYIKTRDEEGRIRGVVHLARDNRDLFYSHPRRLRFDENISAIEPPQS